VPLEEDAMKTLAGAFLTFASLLTPGLVAAQPKTDPMTVEGTVVSSGNTSLVVTADDGTTKTFVLDTTTTLPTTDLEAGNRVAVNYRALDAERDQALSVSLLESATSGASAPPAAATQPTSDTEASGPGRMAGPVSFLGLASIGVVAAFVFAWVFVRRRHEEVPHLSL
jgi:hypothetical protein